MSNFSKIFLLVLTLITAFYLKENFFDKSDFFAKFHKSKTSVEEVNTEKVKNEKDESEEQSKKAIKKNYVYIYFLGVDKEGNSIFKKVKRESDGDSKLESAIGGLLKGPDSSEKKLGIFNEIPKGTRLLSIDQKGNDIIINLSSDFKYGGGTDSIYSRMRQLIKTALANAPHKNVYLYLDGKQVDVIGGEGIMVSQPLSESSLDD